MALSIWLVLLLRFHGFETGSKEEAAVYQEKLGKREPGVLSPYHRTALATLRDLTGRDTEPTAQAWRKLLTLSK